MINTAPQGSNSVNGREKYFKTIKGKMMQWSHGPHFFRGTQRENSSKPLKHSIVKRILVFKR